MLTIHTDYSNPSPVVRKRITNGAHGDIVLANRPIAAGELLCHYRGVIVPPDATITPMERQNAIVLPSGKILLHRDGNEDAVGEYILDPGFVVRGGTTPHVVVMVQPIHVDYPSTHSKQSYANTGWLANCELREEDPPSTEVVVGESPSGGIDSSTAPVGIYATRRIEAGEELFIHYGTNTWILRNENVDPVLTMSGVVELDEIILSYLPDKMLDEMMDPSYWVIERVPPDMNTLEGFTYWVGDLVRPLGMERRPVPYHRATPDHPLALRRDSRIFYWRLCDMLTLPSYATIRYPFQLPQYCSGSDYYALWWAVRRVTEAHTTTSYTNTTLALSSASRTSVFTLSDVLRTARIAHPWGTSDTQCSDIVRNLGELPTPNRGTGPTFGWSQGVEEMLVALLWAEYWRHVTDTTDHYPNVTCLDGSHYATWGREVVRHIVLSDALPLLQPVLDMLNPPPPPAGDINVEGVPLVPIARSRTVPQLSVQDAVSVLWAVLKGLVDPVTPHKMPTSLSTAEALLQWIQGRLGGTFAQYVAASRPPPVPKPEITAMIRVCALTLHHLRSILSILGAADVLDRGDDKPTILRVALASEYCHPASYVEVAKVVARAALSPGPVDHSRPQFVSALATSHGIWRYDISTLCVTYLECARVLGGVGPMSTSGHMGLEHIIQLYNVIYMNLPSDPPIYQAALRQIHRAFLGVVEVDDEVYLRAAPLLRKTLCGFDCLVLAAYLYGYVHRTGGYQSVDASTLSALIRLASHVELGDAGSDPESEPGDANETIILDLIRCRNHILIAASYDIDMLNQLYPVFGPLQGQANGEGSARYQYTLRATSAIHIDQLIIDALYMHYKVTRLVNRPSLIHLIDLALEQLLLGEHGWIDMVNGWMNEACREMGDDMAECEHHLASDNVWPYHGLRLRMGNSKTPIPIQDVLKKIVAEDPLIKRQETNQESETVVRGLGQWYGEEWGRPRGQGQWVPRPSQQARSRDLFTLTPKKGMRRPERRDDRD